jgi:hypothetical protein
MSMKTLETAILAELKQVANNNKIRLKDLQEWRTGKELDVQAGETYYYLPQLGISCAVKLPTKEPKKISPDTQSPVSNR